MCAVFTFAAILTMSVDGERERGPQKPRTFCPENQKMDYVIERRRQAEVLGVVYATLLLVTSCCTKGAANQDESPQAALSAVERL